MSEPMLQMEQWCIYFNPADAPWQYVVRRWTIKAGNCIPDKMAQFKPTLLEARACLPDGLYRLERFPGDDPVIVEVWI
jgi:hypothetical protein